MRTLLLVACLVAAACGSSEKATPLSANQGGERADDPAASGGESPSGGGSSAGKPSNSGGKNASGGRPTTPDGPDEPTDGGTPSEPSGGAGGESGTPPVVVPDDGCSSKRYRLPTESEGEEMNPGFACIACHDAVNGSGDGEAPTPAFAGTLYPTLREPYSCMGVAAQGAEVVVVDKNGVELRATANGSGNFLVLDRVVAPPYSVKVVFQGRERAAQTPHQDVDCNGCHSPGGDLGAPGRVILP